MREKIDNEKAKDMAFDAFDQCVEMLSLIEAYGANDKPIKPQQIVGRAMDIVDAFRSFLEYIFNEEEMDDLMTRGYRKAFKQFMELTEMRSDIEEILQELDKEREDE